MPTVTAANVPCDPGSPPSMFTVEKLLVSAGWVSVQCYPPASSPSTTGGAHTASPAWAALPCCCWLHGLVEPSWWPWHSQALGEVCLSNAIQDPINLIDVIVKKKESMLHTVKRQLMIGSSLSLEKMAAFLTMLTCLIIRNSAVAEIYSLNIINNTALAAGLQTSCQGTRKNKIIAFRVSCSLSRYWG